MGVRRFVPTGTLGLHPPASFKTCEEATIFFCHFFPTACNSCLSTSGFWKKQSALLLESVRVSLYSSIIYHSSQGNNTDWYPAFRCSPLFLIIYVMHLFVARLVLPRVPSGGEEQESEHVLRAIGELALLSFCMLCCCASAADCVVLLLLPVCGFPFNGMKLSCFEVPGDIYS